MKFWCILKLVVNQLWNWLFSWFVQKTSSKLLQNLQVLGQYSRVSHLQVTHFSSIGSILVSITTILTSIVTILASIALAGEHIFQVLAQYSKVLSQYLQVLPQYLQVLSRWIGPKTLDNLWMNVYTAYLQTHVKITLVILKSTFFVHGASCPLKHFTKHTF